MTKLRVLFVDDDTELGNFVSMALTSLGYKVHFQNSLIGIESIIEEFSPSIILFDVEIGQDNGIDRAKKVLSKFKHVPILFVSSHTDAKMIAKGISTGGVAYMRKPFSITELNAYIRRFALDVNILKIASYSLDIREQSLFYNDTLIKKLSKLEFKLLELLISHKKALITKEQIAQTLWRVNSGEEYEANINNLISKIRELLSKDTSVSLKTIRGKGYRLEIK